MLSGFDDAPLHQTAEPLLTTALGPDFAERYRFTGATLSGDVLFAVTVALYPDRGIIDGAFTIARHGRQHTVRSSGRLAPEHRPTAVGALGVEVIEPLRVLRVRVTDDERLGVEADLHFTATAAPAPVPPRPYRPDTVQILDSPQFAQPGTWSGSITVEDDTITLFDEDTVGGRDRCWGPRPLDDEPAGAPRTVLPQAFWLTASVHDDGRWWYGVVDEDAHGHSLGPRGAVERAGLTWRPGTRAIEHLTLLVSGDHEAATDHAMTPRAHLLMRGLGYGDPTWSHGQWKDEIAVGYDEWDLATVDQADVRNLHRLSWCTGTAGAAAFVEYLAVGPHRPTGLTGFTDGAPA